MRGRIHSAIPALMLAFAAGASAQTLPGVRDGDANLDCAAIAQEAQAAKAAPAVERVSADSRADSTVGGLFGALGKAAGGLLGVGTETPAAPAGYDGAAARRDFLARLASAKGCSEEKPDFAGNPLSSEAFQQLAEATPAAAAPAQAPLAPLTPEAVGAALADAPELVPAVRALDGTLDLKGIDFYIAEYRLLFEVAGEASASTSGGYLPGRDYGASRSKVQYTLPQPDIAAFQAITDRAFADFKARLAAAGVALPDSEAFTREHGAVYPATEEASRVGAPVFLEKDLGHGKRKYLVMSPSGMKLHSRGFAGMGAGNIGKRIEWSKSAKDGLSISMAVHLADQQSSGGGSSIFKRHSEASAGAAMSVSQAPDAFILLGHVKAGGLRMTEALPLEGRFAEFRQTGGYDSSKDGVAVAMGILSNVAGLAKVSNTKRVETEVILDGPATARLALKGLASLNEALTEKIKAGL